MTSISPTQDIRRVGLCIDPLDVLFFRDGRPFDAASRAYGGLPLPRTIAGSLRTALLQRNGFDFSKLQQGSPGSSPLSAATTRETLIGLGAPGWILATRFRGPWLALRERSGSALIPLLPSPATLLWSKSCKEWCRLYPWTQGLPGWTDKEILPLWHRKLGDPKHPGGYLTLPGIFAFLRGEEPDKKTEWFDENDLFGYDDRTGIRVDAETLTAARGQIYGARFLSLRPRVKKEGCGNEFEVLLYAEVILPAEAPQSDHQLVDGPIPLGGEGKYAGVKTLDEPVGWACPDLPGQHDRSLWLLATPGIFGERAVEGRQSTPADRPDAIHPPAKLRAAASLHPQAVSGWDIAMNGPRPTRFAVPTGSVYHVEGDFRPPGGSLCASQELAAEGWGFALRGVWNHG